MTPERAQIIDEYRAAYAAANGKEPPQVDYWKGWYSVYRNSVQTKHREYEIVRMTQILREREQSQ